MELLCICFTRAGLQPPSLGAARDAVGGLHRLWFSVLWIDPVEYGVGMFLATLSLGSRIAANQEGLQDCSSTDQQKNGSVSAVHFFAGCGS